MDILKYEAGLTGTLEEYMSSLFLQMWISANEAEWKNKVHVYFKNRFYFAWYFVITVQTSNNDQTSAGIWKVRYRVITLRYNLFSRGVCINRNTGKFMSEILPGHQLGRAFHVHLDGSSGLS
jgi:hypothetical protein